MLRSVGRPSGNYCPNIPRCWEIGQNGSSVLWQRQLSKQQRSPNDCKGETPADEKTGNDEWCDVLSRALENGTDQCPSGAESNRRSPADPVYEPTHEGQCHDGTNRLNGVEQAENRARGVVKLCTTAQTCVLVAGQERGGGQLLRTFLPGWEKLQAVHDHAVEALVRTTKNDNR